MPQVQPKKEKKNCRLKKISKAYKEIGKYRPLKEKKIDKTPAWRIDLWLPRGGGGSGMDWEFGVNRCRLFPVEWISNEILLCSTENSKKIIILFFFFKQLHLCPGNSQARG